MTIPDSSEQKLIELAEWLQRKANSSIGTVCDTEIGYWMQDQALNLRSLISELAELREKAEVLPIIMKILSRAKRGKLASGNPAKWYGLSATHEEIEQLRQMIEQKERTHDQKN